MYAKKFYGFSWGRQVHCETGEPSALQAMGRASGELTEAG